MADIWYNGSDHVLEVGPVKDIDGTAQTDASVSVTDILDENGDSVSGITFPSTGSHTSGGVYRVPLSKDLSVVPSRDYTAKGTVTLASGKVLQFRHTWPAQTYTG